MSRKTLLITGASAGIGAACARLAAPDYDLYLNYRSDTASMDAVRADCEASGAQVTVLQADVSKPDEVDAMFAQIPRLDALFNNAGIVDLIAPLAKIDNARLERMFAVNVIGSMMVAREAAARMSEGGVIINMSSASARLGNGNQFVDYAASKGAIDTFTKGLSDELAPKGIRVLAVRPGLIATDIHAKAGAVDRIHEFAHTIPLRRPGSAEEVARPVLFLMSDGASYMTGSSIDISGGR